MPKPSVIPLARLHWQAAPPTVKSRWLLIRNNILKCTQAMLRIIGSFLMLISCTASFSSPLPSNSNSAASLLDEKPTQVGPYEICLPKGYSEALLQPEIAAKVLARRRLGFDDHLYSGGRRSDGTATTLGLEIAVRPSSTLRKLSLDQVMDSVLEQKKHSWREFTETPKRFAQINGIPVEWVRFGGLVSGRIGTIRADGFIYIAIDGNNMINIQTEDAEAYNKQSLPILQAAVSTFRRRTSK
jgi:hypothetical protein